MKYVLINKKVVDEKNATISIKHRACRFGDGIFETCKIVNGTIYNYSAHEARIINGLEVMQISANIKNLINDCYFLIKKNGLKNGILRISISRGIGSNGYLPAKNIKPLIIIETIKNKKINHNKIVVGVSKIKAFKRIGAMQKCKIMQATNYILAKINANKLGHFDDIILNDEGFVSECSSSNIFWVKNGKIFTAAKNCDQLLGTIYDKILQKFPIKINEAKARISTLESADEIFLTNINFLVLAVDELIIGNKKIKLQKNLSAQVLRLLWQDIKNYKCYYKNAK